MNSANRLLLIHSSCALLIVTALSARAGVNSWVSTTSGNWDQAADWSLGIPPASDQTVNVTNAGYKAVSIDSTTVTGFPNSLTVSSLFVSAPTNGLNTVLLNYAGLSQPLKVLNACTIGTNGTIANDFSSFEVDGSGLLIDGGGYTVTTGGYFTQMGGKTVVNGPVFVRSGEFDATNGDLTVGDLTLGSGTPTFGYFVQAGGTLLAQNVTLTGGAYTLNSGGILYAIGGTHVDGSANFNHGDGTNYGDITVTTGSYRIGAGLAQGNVLTVASDFEQGGGLVNMQEVDWSGHSGGLYGGDLHCGTLNVTGATEFDVGTQWPFNAGTVSAGAFNLSGTVAATVFHYTVFVTNNVDVSGDLSSSNTTLNLRSCSLSASNLTVHPNSMVVQSDGGFGAGSTELSNGLSLEGGGFQLWAGTVVTPYLGVGLGSKFTQSSGQDFVNGVLSLTGVYEEDGGTLATEGLYLRGSLLLEHLYTNSPTAFTNSGSLDFGGYLGVGITNAWPGQVRLSTNGAIDFINTTGQVNFAASSGVAWTPGALLVVSHWNNSGNTRIFFGADASALSGSQLAQMEFSNPGGFAPGLYSAKILNTGEVVPDQALATSSGPVNSWITSTSGTWEDASSWSLGVLPDRSQSIMITNSGWKAVAIDASTPVNLPGSMTVSNLTIGGATNGENTLLLNSFGTATPLSVLNDCNIATNGHVIMLYSGMNAGNAFNLGGVFDQEGGELSFTNSPTNTLQIEGGQFNLTNGVVNGVSVYLGGTNSGLMTQNSGLVSLGWLGLGEKPSLPSSTNSGTYVLQNGWLIVSNLEDVGESGFGTLNQTGGTNSPNSLSVAYGNYSKSDGGLFAGEVRVIGSGSIYSPPSGIMTQAGGTTVITNDLTVEGGGNRHAPIGASFNMFGGSLSASRIYLEIAASFAQSNGTVNVANQLSIDDGGGTLESVYLLYGGNLFTSNAIISSSWPNNSQISQSGGTDVIANTLRINGTAMYSLAGGTVSAPNIIISGMLNNPPQFFVNGAPSFAVANETITLQGGAVVIENSAQQFGSLTLGSDSGVNFAGSSAILHFADSHTNNWNGQVSGTPLPRLLVYNWNGSTSGGGADQLIFGTDQSGLTPSQLNQIQFSIGTNVYAAKILATGEVVPDQGAPVSSGLVNSWINPGSGNWDDASSWSLGVLPNSLQSIMITNSGWKAVAINASTPVNFPGSMTVSNLTIVGATNTENTLLLNSFGTAVPLTVLNGLTLRDGAQILNFNSGLVVQGGTIVVTNSQINQDGGFIRTTNAPMSLTDSAYNLTNGDFEGGQVTLGFPVPAQFNQYGGTVTIANLIFGRNVFGSGGNYALYGGNLNLPGGLDLETGNNSTSSYFQSGGTNVTTDVFMAPGQFGDTPSFTFNGGLLADNNVTLQADGYGASTLTQNGGTHIITNSLSISGASDHGVTVIPGAYNLNNGTLSAGSVSMNASGGTAEFDQTNGFAHVGNFQGASAPFYSYWVPAVNLSGGTLVCSNLHMMDGGDINQSGGALVVSNSLAFDGFIQPGPQIFGTYTLSGGTVTASNISVGGVWIICDSSTNRISNPGTCSLSHEIVISNAQEQLGGFILASSNAAINLAGSASRLSFADSSGETWAGGATLTISNWNGNPSGGGAEQLKFGSNQSGLTSGQLSQVQFQIGTNSYSAKILNTGEVVPDHVIEPSVTFSQQANHLVLSWPPGWTLQTATNVLGPWSDLPTATSPYTNDTTANPQGYFRVKQ